MKRWLAAAALAVPLAAALAWTALGSQAALDYAVRRAIAAAQGHLTIEGAEGSLLSTVRIARIAWRGTTLDVEARDSTVAWSPLDLLSRRVILRGLGARRLVIDVRGGSGGGLPDSLALPLEVEVRNIGVERLEWKTPTQGGYLTGIVFDYEGGAARHEVRRLRFVAPQGTLAGDARMAARAPYDLDARLAFDGDGDLRGAKAQLTLGGTLERMAIDGSGSFHDAAVKASAALTPFAPALLTGARVDARNVDLAKFGIALPRTELALLLEATPAANGFAGSLEARNEAAGALDADRIPVASLAARFAWDGTTLALDDIDAGLSGNARARGSVALAPGGGPVRLDLALRDVDLSRLQTSLIATRLTGTIAGEVERERQVLRGNLAQADLALAFDAVVEGRRVQMRSMRARAGDGTLVGSGRLALDAPRVFAIDARATRFDPSRFVAAPKATLDGTIDARGTLSPFAIEGSVVVDKGSRVADLAFEGSARGAFARRAVTGLSLDAALGGSKVKLAGSFGNPQDALAYDVDLPDLAALRPLAVKYGKVALPDTVAGTLRARGTVSGDPASPGVTVEARGTTLAWGGMARAGALDVKASIAPGPAPLDQRTIKANVRATKLQVAQVALTAARIDVEGSLADHRAKLAAAGGDFDVTASVTGGLRETRRAGGPLESTWNGSVQSFVNRGAYPLTLDGPATVSVARDRYEISNAHARIAEGRVDLTTLLVEQGRITTKGSFTAVPASAVARLAGTPLPFASTLELGGEWSIAASPRLAGTFAVRREKGDWYGTDSATPDPSGLALGISVFDVSGTFADDALRAEARFRSVRAGTADARLTLAAGRVPGRVDADAALAATLVAELASLRPLQPWVGTLAVMDGRAKVAIAARGSLANPVVDGTITGDALRFDLPQYGVHLTDGVLRARLAERAILLDEFSLAGGAGRFTAKGTLAQAAKAAGMATAQVAWQATDFTLVNRPDLRLVADGKGTLALAERKLAIAGSIEIDEGRVFYEPSRPGTLSDDVVIVGRPRREQDAGVRELPLALDVDVDLGRDFRFEGEGLATELAGRVRVTTTPAGALVGRGTINSVSGTYFVFGQRLEIDRGRLLFDGPLANPGLDIVALRKNLAVEAGVEISGTVRVPRVRLVSNPPVSESEKLSWLLTGQGLDRASRNDIAMLGAASASLLGRPGERPITTRIANTFGLDDIAVRDSASSVTAGTSNQVVAFGKRISDRLSLVYEQGLTVATNALRLEYALTRTLTLRAEAGVVSSVGFFFRRSFD